MAVRVKCKDRITREFVSYYGIGGNWKYAGMRCCHCGTVWPKATNDKRHAMYIRQDLIQGDLKEHTCPEGAAHG